MTSHFILILLSAALAASMLVFVSLWRQVQQVRRYCRQLNTAIQRQEREMTQQRYALAILRQKNDADIAADAIVEDDQLMELAFDHAHEPDKAPLLKNDDPVPDAKEISKELGDLKQSEILQFLKRAIKNNQISVSLQPIVKLPQRNVAFFEVFARIQVGEKGSIAAGQFMKVARDNNLMSAIDSVLLLRCLQMIKNAPQKDASAAYFVNVSAATLANRAYVNDLVSFLSANPRLSSRLVFEITQTDSLRLSAETKQVMEGLAMLGCRFSMDHVAYIGLDIDRLVDQNINFVKLNAEQLAQDMQSIDKRGRLKKLKNMLETSGITVIMEKIEHERQLLALVDLYVDYAQGYLFGAPKNIEN